MKGKKTVMILLAACLLLTGCGKGSEIDSASAQEQAAEEQARDTKDAGEELVDTNEEAVEDKVSSKEEVSKVSSGTYPRELEKQELQDFTIWINQGDNYGNYGFLLSKYDKPQDVDLNEVFYTGAGLDVKQLSKEEEAAYLKAIDEEEIYTDITRLTQAQIDEFLLRKLGLSYKEMTHPLEWVYLPEYDIYLNQHGDSNYMNFTCVSGRQTDDTTYELDCVPGDKNYMPDGLSCRLTVQKSGNDYRFVSNKYAEGLTYSMDIWKIDDQCFDVELDGWGKVTFNSYAPDKSMYQTEDAVFKLYDGEKEVYMFPPVAVDNYRDRETFIQVSAVAFQDYNNDGYKDVIIILEYEPMVNTKDGGSLTEVRLYRSRPEKKEFTVDIDRMDYLNMNQYNRTVKDVMAHIGDYSGSAD